METFSYGLGVYSSLQFIERIEPTQSFQQYRLLQKMILLPQMESFAPTSPHMREITITSIFWERAAVDLSRVEGDRDIDPYEKNGGCRFDQPQADRLIATYLMSSSGTLLRVFQSIFTMVASSTLEMSIQISSFRLASDSQYRCYFLRNGVCFWGQVVGRIALPNQKQIIDQCKSGLNHKYFQHKNYQYRDRRDSKCHRTQFIASQFFAFYQRLP